MNKYDMLQKIQELIMENEGYKSNDFMYAHLTGLLSAYVSDKDIEKILQDLIHEQELKNIETDLAYERSVGK